MYRIVYGYASLLASNFFSCIRNVGIDIDDYCNHRFLLQHDLIKEVVEASQEPYTQRKRLMFDMNENNWSQQRQQNTVATTLSISTSKSISFKMQTPLPCYIQTHT